MAQSIRRGRVGLLSFAAILATCPVFAVTPDNYIGGDGGLWSNPANWSAGVPGFFDVTINNPTPITVNLDIGAGLHSLSLFAPDTIAVLGGQTLSLNVTTSINQGTINLAGTNSTLSIISNATISGGGTILMNSSSSAIDMQQIVGRLVTDNLIVGQGRLGTNSQSMYFFKITNNGTISASGGTISLQCANSSDAIINNGVIGANGGTLLLPYSNNLPSGALTNFGSIVLVNGTMSAPK